jgi:hypothetical protein
MVILNTVLSAAALARDHYSVTDHPLKSLISQRAFITKMRREKWTNQNKRLTKVTGISVRCDELLLQKDVMKWI